MKTPINYLGRMIRDAILMMAGVIACLVIGFDMVTKGADLLEWMIYVLGAVCMIAGIYVFWIAGKLSSDRKKNDHGPIQPY